MSKRDLYPLRNHDVIERFGDGLLLFHSSLGTVFEVNETGSKVWLLCDGRHSVQSIEKALLLTYEPRKSIKADVEDFVSRMVQLNFVSLKSKLILKRKGRRAASEVEKAKTCRYTTPRLKEIWSEKSATSGVFLVEI